MNSKATIKVINVVPLIDFALQWFEKKDKQFGNSIDKHKNEKDLISFSFFLIFQTFSILISLAILATSASVRACIKLSLVKRINNVLAMIYGVALQK